MKNKIKYYLIIILIILIYILNNYNKPKLELIGNKYINISLGSEYIEEGSKIINSNNKDITTFGYVNTNKVGEYIIYYKANVNGIELTNSRIVNVVDSNLPVINLLDNENIYMCPNINYYEPGYTSFDYMGKDITNNVLVEYSGDIVSYFVEDDYGNKMYKERKIIREDNEFPTIKLHGDNYITLIKGESYIEEGYSAYDNCDGNITSKVKIDSNLNINSVGEYKIHYSVTDSSNNIVNMKRTIYVVDELKENNKTIYFTFDDGPSSLTIDILDLLKEENIKATFFVINTSDKYNYIIKRAHEEGHTIGLHTYSHNYKEIYKSEGSYFDDLKLISDKVESITHKKTKFIRFPGGSSNTISRISKGLMTKLSVSTKEKGYIYYDWNIESNDTANISSTRIYNKIINQLGKYNTNMILMHDFSGNKKTLIALKKIIKYAKEHGYKFSNITDDTPQITHKIIN